jgi:hypothetical protein
LTYLIQSRPHGVAIHIMRLILFVFYFLYYDFVFVEKIHLIDIYLHDILWMIEPNHQWLMWSFYVIFENRLPNEFVFSYIYYSFFLLSFFHLVVFFPVVVLLRCMLMMRQKKISFFANFEQENEVYKMLIVISVKWILKSYFTLQEWRINKNMIWIS